MSTVHEAIKIISHIWSIRGWSDHSDSITIASRLFSQNMSPQIIAKGLPREFYLQNNLKQSDVVLVLKDLRLASTGSSNELSVLFVSAGPGDQETLRLGAEHRDIMQAIRATKLRDRINLNAAPAARPTDLSNAFNEYLPNILHISGHANSSTLVLEDDNGATVEIDTPTLGRIISVAGKQLKLVVLNACESSAQAKILTKHVDCSIGMSRSVSDDAARYFAVQLYSSLGAGINLKQAFEQAVLDIHLRNLPESDIPKLYFKKGIKTNDYSFNI